jgi:hypothetical protein
MNFKIEQESHWPNSLKGSRFWLFMERKNARKEHQLNRVTEITYASPQT